MEPYFAIEKSEEIFRSETSLIKFIKELLLQNYKIYELNHKNGELIPYHAHGYKEMIIMTRGKMRLIIEEKIIDIEAGDIIKIEPWAIHLSCFVDPEGASFYLCYPGKIRPSNKPAD